MRSRGAIGLLVLLVSEPALVARQSVVCSAIHAGETGPAVALRLTGDADNLYQPWFQIVDSRGRRVPQSQSTSLRSTWRACLAADVATLSRHGQPASERDRRTFDVGFAARVALVVFLALLSGSLADEYVRRTRTVPAPLRQQAERFVEAFARPLLRRPSAMPPIRTRLRYLPARDEVEILIAPGSGRRYPNLADHRLNLDYDVRRVLRLLDGRLVVTKPLRVEGPWVVIPVRSMVDVRKAGTT